MKCIQQRFSFLEIAFSCCCNVICKFKQKMIFFHLLKCHMLMIFPLIVNQQLPTVTFCESALFTFFYLLQSPIKIGGTSFHREMSSNEILQIIDSSIKNMKLKVHFLLFSYSCNLQSRVGGTSLKREMQSNEILQMIDSSIKKYIKIKVKVHFSLFFLHYPIKSSWGISFHREMSSNKILQYVDSRSSQNCYRIDRKISQKLAPFLQVFQDI